MMLTYRITRKDNGQLVCFIKATSLKAAYDLYDEEVYDAVAVSPDGTQIESDIDPGQDIVLSDREDPDCPIFHKEKTDEEVSDSFIETLKQATYTRWKRNIIVLLVVMVIAIVGVIIENIITDNSQENLPEGTVVIEEINTSGEVINNNTSTTDINSTTVDTTTSDIIIDEMVMDTPTIVATAELGVSEIDTLVVPEGYYRFYPYYDSIQFNTYKVDIFGVEILDESLINKSMPYIVYISDTSYYQFNNGRLLQLGTIDSMNELPEAYWSDFGYMIDGYSVGDSQQLSTGTYTIQITNEYNERLDVGNNNDVAVVCFLTKEFRSYPGETIISYLKPDNNGDFQFSIDNTIEAFYVYINPDIIDILEYSVYLN